MLLLGYGLGDDAATTAAPATGVDTSAAASASSSLTQSVAAFLQATPQPSSSDVASFLKTFSDAGSQTAAAQALVAAGVDINTVSHGLTFVTMMPSTSWSYVRGVATVVAASAALFHGYRRNQSLGWGLVWFGSGMIFPVVTSVVALAQGFGKRKSV